MCNRRETSLHVVAALARSGSAAGAGQSSRAATVAAAPAISQPASRSGIEDAGADSDTERMNARSSPVDAEARTELTTPLNNTAKPTTAIDTVATATC
jgi:hypothetical protein